MDTRKPKPRKVTPVVLTERRWFAKQVKKAENPTPADLEALDQASDELDRLFDKS